MQTQQRLHIREILGSARGPLVPQKIFKADKRNDGIIYGSFNSSRPCLAKGHPIDHRDQIDPIGWQAHLVDRTRLLKICLRDPMRFEWGSEGAQRLQQLSSILWAWLNKNIQINGGSTQPVYGKRMPTHDQKPHPRFLEIQKQIQRIFTQNLLHLLFLNTRPGISARDQTGKG